MKSTDPNTPATEIEAAFEALHPGYVADAYFEHGQWYVVAIAEDSDCVSVDSDEFRTFSVCDAVGSPSEVCDGLSFEALS